MAKQTRGQKAAATLGSKHMAEIGAKGGKKTPGTFQTLRGLAKKAGKRSGLARRIKGKEAEIESLYDERHGKRGEKRRAIQKQINHAEYELEKLKAEFDGVHYVDTGDTILKYEDGGKL